MPDEKYESHYKHAKKAGLNVGAYYFGYELNAGDAATAAKKVIKHLKGKKFEYPIYYDIEWEEIFKLGKKKVSKIAASFCDVIEKGGYYCGIYSSLSFLMNTLLNKLKRNMTFGLLLGAIINQKELKCGNLLIKDKVWFQVLLMMMKSI